MYDEFKLPIEYLNEKNKLTNTIVDDLELISTKDSSNNSVYSILFQPKTPFGKNIIPKWSNYTTTDKTFLRDTKKNILDNSYNFQFDYANNFKNMYEDLKKDNGFKSKYQYVDWDKIDFLNNHEFFLQGLSLYNLSSPVFGLILPIISLIIPFLILKITKKVITFSGYKSILLKQLSNHPIGRMFSDFTTVSPSKKMYYLSMLFIYLLNIYQNVISCYTFYCNFDKIHHMFSQTNHFFKEVSNKLTDFSNTFKQKSHTSFIQNCNIYNDKIKNYLSRINYLEGNPLKNIFLIGKKMKLFYDIRYNKDFESIVNYSFGIVGFIDCLQGLQEHLHKKKVNFCKLGNNSNFKKFYHPSLLDKKPITNNLSCNHNYIISGPNASGKTTLLKSLCINQILSQQIFCGFYKQAKINCYHYFHIYLNIPETSGRDSLFQAEARQCKHILDSILQFNKYKHFCIFDELYSGTNPIEAVGSALAYLQYLNTFENVSYFLTTHFLDICKKLDNHLENKNISMKTISSKEEIEYTYKIDCSISDVTCGYKVLKQLNYPQEILKNISFI